jgi:hypothetical protein
VSLPASRVLGVAGAAAAVLYLLLDSGLARAEPAPKILSVTLGVLALLFALGTWTAGIMGEKTRQPMLLGLALALGGYAVFRLFAF